MRVYRSSSSQFSDPLHATRYFEVDCTQCARRKDKFRYNRIESWRVQKVAASQYITGTVVSTINNNIIFTSVL
jgi:hypothetical protein